MLHEDQQPFRTRPQAGVRVIPVTPGGMLSRVVAQGASMVVAGRRAQPALTLKPTIGKPGWGDLGRLLRTGAPR